MASYKKYLRGDIYNFTDYIKKQILAKSGTASLEEEMWAELGETRCCMQAFERYSAAGGNRVSLTVTTLGYDGELSVMATSTGGSEAMFFKINTLGENSFLEVLKEEAEAYQETGTEA